MDFKREHGGETDELYNELFTPLFRYVYLRTKSYDLASDLTQSAFLKFLLQENRPTTKEHSQRLLFTIARTLLIDHWRVSGKRAEESIEGTNFDTESDMPSPERNFEISENEILVKKILSELKETEEEVVILRLTSDMSYEDIAESLSISSSNARQIYRRALQKVKKLLEEKHISYTI